MATQTALHHGATSSQPFAALSALVSALIERSIMRLFAQKVGVDFDPSRRDQYHFVAGDE
jgi:hypothetical protein